MRCPVDCLKVIGVAARAVMAPVVDLEPIGNGADHPLVREPMSKNLRGPLTARRYGAVAVSTAYALELPAPRWSDLDTTEHPLKRIDPHIHPAHQPSPNWREQDGQWRENGPDPLSAIARLICSSRDAWCG